MESWQSLDKILLMILTGFIVIIINLHETNWSLRLVDFVGSICHSNFFFDLTGNRSLYPKNIYLKTDSHIKTYRLKFTHLDSKYILYLNFTFVMCVIIFRKFSTIRVCHNFNWLHISDFNDFYMDN